MASATAPCGSRASRNGSQAAQASGLRRESPPKPTIEHLHRCYEPFNWPTRGGLSRASLRETCPNSVQRETET
jgi:hypothetical protein